MALVIKDRVKETSTTTGTGTLTLAGAVTGFRSFADIGNSNTCPYVLLEDSESSPTAWEVGIGTYTSSGTTLARTTVLWTSAGGTSAINLSSGTHTVFCGWPAALGLGSAFAQQAVIPGGRLTLESGVPVSTTDQTAKTTIYYTPYVHNVCSLWDGARWVPTVFAETSLALGTLTSGKPYDVFAYLSSGALTLESLVWTNDTTRATAVTLQDGRYCKSGDKTRLLLGTFYTSSTTTTADSASTRYLCNAYNTVVRPVTISNSTSHTYTTATVREWNNSSSKAYFLQSLVSDAVVVGFVGTMTAAGAAGYVGLGFNSTSTESVGGMMSYGGNAGVSVGGSTVKIPVAGLNYVAGVQYGVSGTTYNSISAYGAPKQ